MQKKPIRIIAAACNNLGIGKDGHLPWHLTSEYKFFFDTVTSVSRPGMVNMLVWGKATWFSPDNIFPMPNVLHMVLSKSLSSVPEHAHYICSDFETGVGQALLPPLSDLVETIWIVGGHQVYKVGLEHPWCDMVYLTAVMADFDCDVFFPKFNDSIFRKQESVPGVPNEIQEENGIKYKFQVFKKEVL